MASPLPIPNYATTGGGYWPTAGTIPICNTSNYYSLSDDTAGVTKAWKLQAWSSPGVDPIDLETLPLIRSGGYIYIPSLGTLHRVSMVRQPVEGYGVNGLTATLVFDPGSAPVGMAANTPTQIRVIDTSCVPLKIVNQGAADGEINGNVIGVGEFFLLTEPCTYDATPTEFAISKRY